MSQPLPTEQSGRRLQFLQLLGFLWTDKKIRPLGILVFLTKALFLPLTQLSYSPGWEPIGWAIVNNQIHPPREGKRPATSEGTQEWAGAILNVVSKKGFELQQPCWKKVLTLRNPNHLIGWYWYRWSVFSWSSSSFPSYKIPHYNQFKLYLKCE